MRQTRLISAVLLLTGPWQVSALIAKKPASTKATASVTLSSSAPGTVQPLLSTLVSFSIEQDRWPEWVGVSQPNQFTQNALLNLAQITGQPPKIRVGANSEDHTTWDPSVTVVQETFPPFTTIIPYPEAKPITVGDGFYQLSKQLPSGTHMTWGVNFGLDNITNAVNMAQSIVRAFNTPEVQAANVILDLIEVGNEADLYQFNGLRPSGFTQQQYVTDWISVAGAVAQAAGLVPGGKVGLQAASFAGQGYTCAGIIQDGILNSTPGKVIKQFSQHHYSGAFCSGGNFILSSFMNKASVRGNLSIFNNDAAVVKSNGFPYMLGETNSIACHGAPGVSNTAGAALWAIDYTLQAASLGMLEVFFHEGIGFKYDLFQALTLNRSILDGSPLNPPQPPHVQPTYYAAILVAHAVGNTGTAQIVEVSVPLTTVSGYAVYEAGVLKRAVFVNLDAWLTTSTGTRPSVHLNLAFQGTAPGNNAHVQRVTIQHADDVANVLFGGLSYETSNALASGTPSTETVCVKNGVDIASTEAILLTFIP